MYKIKFFISIIIMIISLQVHSQTLKTTSNSNNLNNNIDNFIGTWYWKDNGKSLKIIFKKDNIDLPMYDNVKTDVLIGFHKYISNNIVVENSTQYINSRFTDKKSTILGTTYESSNKLEGTIKHVSKNKSLKFKILYIDSKHIKLEMLENINRIRINQSKISKEIDLPQNIILTKE